MIIHLNTLIQSLTHMTVSNGYLSFYFLFSSLILNILVHGFGLSGCLVSGVFQHPATVQVSIFRFETASVGSFSP